MQLRDFSRQGGRIAATLLLSIDTETALSRIVERSKFSTRSDDEFEIVKQRIDQEWRRISELLCCPEIEKKLFPITAESDEAHVVIDVLNALSSIVV